MIEKRDEPSDRAILELIRSRVHDQANETAKLVLQLGLIQKDVQSAMSQFNDHEIRLRSLESLSPTKLIEQNDRDHDAFRKSLENITHTFEQDLNEQKLTFRAELQQLRAETVPIDRFTPVQRVVYSMIGVMLLAVLTAILSRVLVK